MTTVIRNPVALAAWIARKNMARMQEQQQATLTQQGAPAAIDQNLIATLMAQRAVQSQQVRPQGGQNLGVYNYLFLDNPSRGDYNLRRAAYKQLN